MNKEMKNIMDNYRMIVGSIGIQRYSDPEEQARSIKKCTLLKSVGEISYSDNTNADYRKEYGAG